jgi:hypothetical protein
MTSEPWYVRYFGHITGSEMLAPGARWKPRTR